MMPMPAIILFLFLFNGLFCIFNLTSVFMIYYNLDFYLLYVRVWCHLANKQVNLVCILLTVAHSDSMTVIFCKICTIFVLQQHSGIINLLPFKNGVCYCRDGVLHTGMCPTSALFTALSEHHCLPRAFREDKNIERRHHLRARWNVHVWAVSTTQTRSRNSPLRFCAGIETWVDWMKRISCLLGSKINADYGFFSYLSKM